MDFFLGIILVKHPGVLLWILVVVDAQGDTLRLNQILVGVLDVVEHHVVQGVGLFAVPLDTALSWWITRHVAYSTLNPIINGLIGAQTPGKPFRAHPSPKLVTQPGPSSRR